MSLPTLLSEFNHLEELIVSNGGEISQEIEQRLQELECNLSEKVDSLAYIVERCPAISAFYRQQAQKYTQIARFFDNLEDRVKSYVNFAMETSGQDRVSGSTFEFRLLAQRASVVVHDLSILPQEFVEFVPSALKQKIKDAIEGGETVAGAGLSFKRPVQVRPVRKEIK